MFKLALVQMHVEGGEKAQNLHHAKEMIYESAKNGADIALLPEAMNLGWTHPSAKSDADPIPDGDTCRTLIQSAKKNNIYVCCGLVEKDGARIYNSAVLISKKGEIILHHRKINELEIGHEYYDQGSKLNVCNTEFGTAGLMICSDAFAVEKVLSKSLGYMGADFILSPSSWAMPEDWDNSQQSAGSIWSGHYASVAEQFQIWIAGVSNVGEIKEGPWRGYSAIGNSLVIAPSGKIAAEAPFGVNAEIIMYVDIQPVKRPARANAWANYWQANHLKLL